MSNKRKLNKQHLPRGGSFTDDEPFGNWTPNIHIMDIRRHPTCGECGKELHNFMGTVQGMLRYRCDCGCWNYCLIAIESQV